eukprot:6580912-Heterocapsa_arctica.AAC.1
MVWIIFGDISIIEVDCPVAVLSLKGPSKGHPNLLASSLAIAMGPLAVLQERFALLHEASQWALSFGR